jgi:hypothetical protein
MRYFKMMLLIAATFGLVSTAPARATQQQATEKAPEMFIDNLKSREATVAAVALVIGVSEMCRIDIDTQMPRDPDIGKKVPVFVGTMGYVVDEAFVRDLKNMVVEKTATFANTHPSGSNLIDLEQ